MSNKICIAGNNNIAVDILEYLINTYPQNEYIAVPNKTDAGKNCFNKSLRFYAKEWNIPTVDLPQVYDVKDLLLLSLQFDRIIDIDAFQSSRLYNIHFSLLPEYKGMYPSALPILHGSDKTGVTLHKIDNGIDTGDIIDQFEFMISDNDTCRDLYIKNIECGTKLVLRNIENLINNNVQAKAQPKSKSTYYSKKELDYTCLEIDLNVTAFQLTNQLRAFSFREYQLPVVNDRKIGGWAINDTRSCQKSGSQLRECYEYIEVATIDFDVRLYYDFYDELWNACEIDDVNKLERLLPHIEDLNVRNNRGWSALIIASYNGSTNCMQLLLENGADVNLPNYNGTTPLMYAKSYIEKNNDYRPFDLLLEYKADIDVVDVYNKNVLDWAKEENEDIYMKLMKRVNR